MKIRHESEKSYRSDNLIVYTKNGSSHNEAGAAYVDRRFGSVFYLGGIKISSSKVNLWETEHAVEVRGGGADFVSGIWLQVGVRCPGRKYEL